MASSLRRAGMSALSVALALAIPMVVPQSTQASGGTVLPASTCSSTAPCLEWDNLSRGAGLIGTSKKGNGVIGQTKAPSSLSGAGVEGVDTSTTNFRNYGVLGTSLLGNGVTGYAGSPLVHPSGDGVFGASTVRNGVEGEIEGSSGALSAVFGDDQTGVAGNSGVRGASSAGNGVSGFSTNGNGVQGLTLNAAASGVYGENDATGGYGIAGRNTADGFGVLADNPSSTGNYPALYVHQSHGSLCPCLEILVNNSAFDPMTLDTDGNMVLLGTLTQNGFARTTMPTNSGRKVVAYAPSAAQPAIEDFGEAQLVDGQASVRLDATFASTIDPRAPYLVFITPDGATTGGLYVSSKTATGFTVRENGNGRSSIVFDYRIVAKPYGASAPRLPIYAPPHFPKVHLPAAWHERG